MIQLEFDSEVRRQGTGESVRLGYGQNMLEASLVGWAGAERGKHRCVWSDASSTPAKSSGLLPAL